MRERSGKSARLATVDFDREAVNAVADAEEKDSPDDEQVAAEADKVEDKATADKSADKAAEKAEEKTETDAAEEKPEAADEKTASEEKNDQEA